MLRYIILFALSCAWGVEIETAFADRRSRVLQVEESERESEEALMIPRCKTERERGCTHDYDCCIGTCTKYPWTTMCQEFAIYKAPTTAPSFEPTLFLSGAPSVTPSDSPTEPPTKGDNTGTPSLKPSATPTTKPSSFEPTTKPTPAATPGKKTFPILFAEGNQIVDQNGSPVRIAGINYFGFEGPNFCVLGLDKRNLRDLLLEIQGFGFNALRVPVSSEMLRGSYPLAMNYELNPQFRGLSSVEILKEMVNICDQIGLMVLIDRHSSIAGNYHNEPMPFIDSPYYTLQQFYKDWEFLAELFLDNPSVIGFDMFNEPEKGEGWQWETWADIAAEAGNRIHAINPKPLILVEGHGSYEGQFYWWGGLLAGVEEYLPPLNMMNKLVFSPHVYPNSVWPMDWFRDPTFPSNLKDIWKENWAYLFTQNDHPIWIGEFGFTWSDLSDRIWLDNLIPYIDGDFNNNGRKAPMMEGKTGMSFTIWCVNPESSDTDALYAPDYKTVNKQFLDVVKPLLENTPTYVE